MNIDLDEYIQATHYTGFLNFVHLFILISAIHYGQRVFYKINNLNRYSF